MPYIYLAGPYSHQDATVKEVRYELHRQAAWFMLRYKRWCYSPIVHCHPLAQYHELPTDFAYWQAYNEAMLAEADELWVIKLHGWMDSKGVAAEVKFADDLAMNIEFKAPEWFGIDNPEF